MSSVQFFVDLLYREEQNWLNSQRIRNEARETADSRALAAAVRSPRDDDGDDDDLESTLLRLVEQQLSPTDPQPLGPMTTTTTTTSPQPGLVIRRQPESAVQTFFATLESPTPEILTQLLSSNRSCFTAADSSARPPNDGGPRGRDDGTGASPDGHGNRLPLPAEYSVPSAYLGHNRYGMTTAPNEFPGAAEEHNAVVAASASAGFAQDERRPRNRYEQLDRQNFTPSVAADFSAVHGRRVDDYYYPYGGGGANHAYNNNGPSTTAVRGGDENDFGYGFSEFADPSSARQPNGRLGRQSMPSTATLVSTALDILEHDLSTSQPDESTNGGFTRQTLSSPSDARVSAPSDDVYASTMDTDSTSMYADNTPRNVTGNTPTRVEKVARQRAVPRLAVRPNDNNDSRFVVNPLKRKLDDLDGSGARNYAGNPPTPGNRDDTVVTITPSSAQSATRRLESAANVVSNGNPSTALRQAEAMFPTQCCNCDTCNMYVEGNGWF